MTRYFFIFFFILLFLGCSKPLTVSKWTQSLSLKKNLHISKVIFNNLEEEKFHLDEEKIEEKLLEIFNINHLKQKKELTINLINIKKEVIKEPSSLNIHNIVAVATMLTTRILPDTSTIDSNKVFKIRFVLNVILEEQKSKLFIEISDYGDDEALEALFKEELFQNIEEILK